MGSWGETGDVSSARCTTQARVHTSSKQYSGVFSSVAFATACWASSYRVGYPQWI